MQAEPIHLPDTSATPPMGDDLRPDPSGKPPPPSRGNLSAATLAYQQKYQSLVSARAYDTGYSQRRVRTTLREMAIVRGFLRRYGDSLTILDVPSGGGRLSASLAEQASLILEMDIARGQLLLGRENRLDTTQQDWIRASALDIPLRDASVDGAVCIRLSHHLYSVQERERLLAELLRVVRRFVVFHYVDGHSPRYLLRAWRNKLAATPRRTNWMTYREVEASARRHGATVVARVAARPLQPHQYALIEKPDAGPRSCR